jgi:beta-lactamase class A
MQMKKIALVSFLALSTLAFAAPADLQAKLQEMASKHHGKVALYAKNLKTGDTVALDADIPVQTASVIKLPIMIEAMYQVKAGKLKLDQHLRLTKDNQVPGSGVLPFLSPGLDLTLEDTITLMMILSDNTATNMTIDAVTIPAVNKRIESMGLKNTYLYKKVYKPAEGPMPPDQKKFGLGKTTAREMAVAMESVERCEIGDPALCKRMLEIMRNQQYRNMIPHYIETVDTSETPSAIADKIGALDAVRNDVALVFTKSGPLVISVFTYENKDQRWVPENEAELLIARMAKLIVDTWGPQLRSGEAIVPDEKVSPKPHD